MSDAGAGLLDAALRLLRLLAGPDGARMRHITSSQGRVAQVGRAIAWIQQNFRQRFSIERLATEAGMSTSSLHEHFRAVTATRLRASTPIGLGSRLHIGESSISPGS